MYRPLSACPQLGLASLNTATPPQTVYEIWREPPTQSVLALAATALGRAVLTGSLHNVTTHRTPGAAFTYQLKPHVTASANIMVTKPLKVGLMVLLIPPLMMILTGAVSLACVPYS